MHLAFNSFHSNLQLFPFYISVQFHNSMSRWSRGIAPAAYRSQSTGNECSFSYIFHRKHTHESPRSIYFLNTEFSFFTLCFILQNDVPITSGVTKNAFQFDGTSHIFPPTAILVLYYLHFLFTFPVLAYHAARRGKTTSFKDTETVFTY